jgi:Cullin family
MTGMASAFKVNIRDGEPISASLLLSSLQILSTLGVYKGMFEENLVESTQTYYHSEAENLSMIMLPAEYIDHVDERLILERNRCIRFFERESEKEVMEVVQQELIADLHEHIIETGFNDLVKTNDIDSLKTLYHLLTLVKETEVLRTAWAEYIKVSPSLTILI